ncbi:MAG: integrase arm-type DNA-binding domain-containing protein [Rhodopseudomonas palustris]|uniref:Integrase arm-type DNA-binding domain-containing protein n=1 Tax=Rhodopseudomonas palustris TaxID=1076 RepID=A0A933RUM5_RHOPL|nr:integrase arm-type DNA-binding domain-containing protein [Rhodopseudomonas palustris]
MPKVATRHPRKPLTSATACDAAKPEAKPYKRSAGGGLHLLVNPDGSKYWRLAYRFAGRQKTLAFGVYPTVGLSDARAARDAAKRDLASGRDPSAVKRQRKREARVAAENTFEAVALEWHEKWKRGRSEFYAGQIVRRLELDVFPQIGRLAIADIEAPEILDLLRRVEGRGRHETARRLRQLIGMIFRFAIVTGRAKRDPSADLKGALESPDRPKRHHAMPRKDLPGFLRSLDDYDGEMRTRLALKLVVLTFLRATELRAGRWDEIEDLDGPIPLWRVPAARMKMRRDHLVPLSSQAVAVLHDLRKLPGSSDTPFLFPSPGREGVMSGNTLLFALYRMGFHGRATVHGFRAVASTILNESNLFRSDWIERQLAHVEKNEIRAAYNAAEWLSDRRRMMDWWGDFIESQAQLVQVTS